MTVPSRNPQVSLVILCFDRRADVSLKDIAYTAHRSVNRPGSKKLLGDGDAFEWGANGSVDYHTLLVLPCINVDERATDQSCVPDTKESSEPMRVLRRR